MFILDVIFLYLILMDIYKQEVLFFTLVYMVFLKFNK